MVGGRLEYIDNSATLWSILQAEICKNLSLAKSQDGPSVTISQVEFVWHRYPKKVQKLAALSTSYVPWNGLKRFV